MISIIGIDPSFRENGMGICRMYIDEKDVKMTFVYVQNVIDALGIFEKAAIITSDVVFVVENSNLQNVTFAKYKGSLHELQKISRNIGANQAVSQLIVDYLRAKSCEVVEVAPDVKGRKWSQHECKAVAKEYGIDWPERTSQDKRDAFKLAIQYAINQKYL